MESCDLPDICNGMNITCVDAHKPSGTSCYVDPSKPSELSGFCNRGHCQSRVDLCKVFKLDYSPICAEKRTAQQDPCLLYCAKWGTNGTSESSRYTPNIISNSTNSNEPRCVTLSYGSSPHKLNVYAPDFTPCVNLTNGESMGSCYAGKCYANVTLGALATGTGMTQLKVSYGGTENRFGNDAKGRNPGTLWLILCVFLALINLN
jgi:hypothetical protein